MAYITNKKRNTLVKSINSNYTLRKILILSVVVLVLLFMIFTIVSVYEWILAGYVASQKAGAQAIDVLRAQIEQGWSWFQLISGSWEEGHDLQFSLSPLGWWMAIWGLIILGGAVFSVVLTFTMKSPKSVRKDVKTLESAALSGRKLTSKDISTKIMKERTSLVEKKPKKRG